MDTRFGRVKWGKGNPRKRTSASYWKQPRKWNAQPWICDECGMAHALPSQICMTAGCDCEDKHKATVFPSLCDWLDPEVPVVWLADFLALIHATPNLRWLLLTKRPHLFEHRLKAAIDDIAGDGFLKRWIVRWMHNEEVPNNVAIGVSAEDQQRWDERVPLLLQIPARWRFVSVEPMLGPINMNAPAYVPGWAATANGLSRINQVIFGGESDPGARPCDIEWIRGGVRQSQEAGVKAFVKQLGSNSYVPAPFGPLTGKANDPSQWPTDLRIREALV